MSNENMLQELKNNNLIEISVGFDEWVEGYKGLRRNAVDFTENKEKFNSDKNTCIVVSKNGIVNEEGLKVAYKDYLVQKISLPYMI